MKGEFGSKIFRACLVDGSKIQKDEEARYETEVNLTLLREDETSSWWITSIDIDVDESYLRPILEEFIDDGFEGEYVTTLDKDNCFFSKFYSLGIHNSLLKNVYIVNINGIISNHTDYELYVSDISIPVMYTGIFETIKLEEENFGIIVKYENACQGIVFGSLGENNVIITPEICEFIDYNGIKYHRDYLTLDETTKILKSFKTVSKFNPF